MDEEESMKCKKNLWFQGSALLLIAITVLLGPGAVAQSKYKTLYKFKDGKDGGFTYAGLIFDQKGNLYGITGLGGTGRKWHRIQADAKGGRKLGRERAL